MVRKSSREKWKGTRRFKCILESTRLAKKHFVPEEVPKEATNITNKDIMQRQSVTKKTMNKNDNDETRKNNNDKQGKRYVEGSLDLSDIKTLRQTFSNKIIIGQLNINSLRNKFFAIKGIIKTSFDVFLISETKLDASFPVNQFKKPGFSAPYRLDRNCYGGGLLLYVRNSIPSKLLKFENHYEGFLVKINLKKKRWLIVCSYNLHIQTINNHLHDINKFDMPDFCESLNLFSLITSPTCFKNPENPSCIDLMLTSHPKSFEKSFTMETGISDFHKTTVTILKSNHPKLPPKFINTDAIKTSSTICFMKRWIK